MSKKSKLPIKGMHYSHPTYGQFEVHWFQKKGPVLGCELSGYKCPRFTFCYEVSTGKWGPTINVLLDPGDWRFRFTLDEAITHMVNS